MTTLREIALSFPLVIFTVLLSLVALFWLLVALRLVPMEFFEHDSLRDEHLASTLVSLGFAGVPAAFSLTVLLMLAGGFTLVVELVVLRELSLGFFRVPLGVGVLWASLTLASPLAAVLCRRAHRWFHRHSADSRRCLLGERVEVKGEPDTGGWTTAVLVDEPDCEVWLHGKPESMPHAGERRVLVKYLPEEAAYRSVAVADYLEARTRLRRLRLVQKRRGHKNGNGNGDSLTSP